MVATVLDVVGIAVAVLVVGAALLTVLAVVRDRPAQAPRARSPERIRGRNLRVWQASVVRELRRAGRPRR